MMKPVMVRHARSSKKRPDVEDLAPAYKKVQSHAGMAHQGSDFWGFHP